MLTLNDVSFRYGRHTEALCGITCSVGPGLHLLAGENGAGKTTLLHIMGGLLYPTSGSCRFNGADTRRRLPSVLSRVQYFGSQNPDGFPASDMRRMTARHACFFPRFDMELLRGNLDAFGVDFNMKFSAMSAGTFNKAALAYMLSLRCDLLLLDEPSVWLDPVARRIFNRLLMACVGPDQAVVVSTHDFSEADTLYDSIMVLRGGHLLLSGDMSAIGSCLACVSSTSRPAGALYSEPYAGGFRSIVPCAEGVAESQPDIRLLYSALVSDSGHRIVELLKTSRDENTR